MSDPNDFEKTVRVGARLLRGERCAAVNDVSITHEVRCSRQDGHSGAHKAVNHELGTTFTWDWSPRYTSVRAWDWELE